MGYWELHIREDERHGRWMLDDVALSLAEQYPKNAWELLLGYDQEKLMAIGPVLLLCDQYAKQNNPPYSFM